VTAATGKVATATLVTTKIAASSSAPATPPVPGSAATMTIVAAGAATRMSGGRARAKASFAATPFTSGRAAAAAANIVAADIRTRTAAGSVALRRFERRRGGGNARDYQASGSSGEGAEMWGGSGFGGLDDNGRRFDRIDAGSTGTQGAHPMSSPVGGGFGGGGIGASGGMGGGSSARSAAIIRQAQQQQGGHSDYHGQQYGQQRGQQSGGGQQSGFGRPQDHHDHHYSEWRNRQIEELDRDYHEYRQEHQSKFEQEFGGWRQKRQSQRQLMGRVTEHMEVLGSDGQHIGTVDKVRGDRIILTKNDENAGGIHHSIPCSWVETVEDKVTVNKSAAEAMAAWTNEDQNRALFERSDQGSDGPHILNRSFSNTYDEKKD
jgi:hypothetical protein